MSCASRFSSLTLNSSSCVVSCSSVPPASGAQDSAAPTEAEPYFSWEAWVLNSGPAREMLTALAGRGEGGWGRSVGSREEKRYGREEREGYGEVEM